MKLYELSFGRMKHFVGARDEQHAYDQGTDPEKFPGIHYLPFEITAVTVPGCTITVKPDSEEAPKRGRQSAS